nr:NAD-binding protein [Opitutales bacterium]
NIHSTNVCSAAIAKTMGCRFVIARVNNDGETKNKIFNLQRQFNIDLTFDPNSLCAFEIAKIIRGAERTTIENFTRHCIEARRFVMKSGSNFINQPLSTLNIPSDLRIINISHNGQNNIPNGHSVIMPEDIITVAGSSEALEHFRKKLSDKDDKKTAIDVVMFGQKRTTSGLIRFLGGSKYQTTLLEKDRQTCEELSEEFSSSNILNGDCTSPTFLDEEQVCECDYFIACSASDERNIMCAAQAKYLGAKYTIALLNSKNYEPLMYSMHQKFGIDYVVSKRQASVNEISSFISDKPYNEIFKMEDQNISFIEFRIDSNSHAVGKKIKDLMLPVNCILISLIHDFAPQTPSGNNEIAYGDRVICATARESIPALIRALT